MYCCAQQVRPQFTVRFDIIFILVPHSNMPQIMVVSSEGYFYSYNIDLENGGECSLMKQYKFVSCFPLVQFLSNHVFVASWTRKVMELRNDSFILPL